MFAAEREFSRGWNDEIPHRYQDVQKTNVRILQAPFFLVQPRKNLFLRYDRVHDWHHLAAREALPTRQMFGGQRGLDRRQNGPDIDRLPQVYCADLAARVAWNAARMGLHIDRLPMVYCADLAAKEASTSADRKSTRLNSSH